MKKIKKKKTLQDKTYKRALMTNNEVEAESLPLSPLKYFKHSWSSLHFYVNFSRVNSSSAGALCAQVQYENNSNAFENENERKNERNRKSREEK